MFELQSIHSNSDFNEPISVVIVSDNDAVADDNAIELEISTSNAIQKGSTENTDNGSSSEKIKLILKNAWGGTLGLIYLSADAIRESGNQIDKLLENVLQQNGVACKARSQPQAEGEHEQPRSPTDIVYNLISFMDQKSYLLEATACAVDDTAGWFQCDGQRGGYDEKWFMSELHEGTQCFGDAVRESMMGCQAESEETA